MYLSLWEVEVLVKDQHNILLKKLQKIYDVPKRMVVKLFLLVVPQLFTLVLLNQFHLLSVMDTLMLF